MSPMVASADLRIKIGAVLPNIVTHIYHSGRGAFRNLCELPPSEAVRIIMAMRDTGRPRLTPEYLGRRLATEDWLIQEAGSLLREPPSQRPLYGFLGTFGHLVDPSRPCAVQLPLEAFGPLTFTLGDSMRVAGRADRRLFNLMQLRACAADGTLGTFSFSDAEGCPGDFVEVQIWEREFRPRVRQILRHET